MSLGGFVSLIYKKGARHKPLSNTPKELNRVKSAIRSRVEHGFWMHDNDNGRKDDQNDWVGANRDLVGSEKPHIQLRSISAVRSKPVYNCGVLKQDLALSLPI